MGPLAPRLGGHTYQAPQLPSASLSPSRVRNMACRSTKGQILDLEQEVPKLDVGELGERQILGCDLGDPRPMSAVGPRNLHFFLKHLE